MYRACLNTLPFLSTRASKKIGRVLVLSSVEVGVPTEKRRGPSPSAPQKISVLIVSLLYLVFDDALHQRDTIVVDEHISNCPPARVHI